MHATWGIVFAAALMAGCAGIALGVLIGVADLADEPEDAPRSGVPGHSL